MKRSMLWMIFAALLLLTACGALSSGEIVLPEAADLDEVTITVSGLELTVRDEDFTAQLLDLLKQSVNTGKASVQDVPEKGDGLIQIDFGFKEGGTSTVFLYRDSKGLFLEQPYQGIYALDSSLEKQFYTQIALEMARLQTEE